MSTVGSDETAERRGRGRPRAPEVSDAIINATVQLLAEGGVEAATIEAIAARAGVGRPSIYRRWPSIGDLIADVMSMATAREIPVPDTGSLRSDLTQVVDDLIQAMSEPIGLATAALIAYATSHPEMSQESPAQLRRRQTTRIITDRAIARGELPKNADADLILDLVAAPIWMTLLVWRRPLSTLNAKAIVDTVLDGALG